MKSNAKSSDKKGKTIKTLFRSSRATVILSLFAIVLIVVNLVLVSYSWFSPASQKGTGIKYNTSINFRSEKCEMKQYTGTNTNGVIEYTPITAGSFERKLSGGQNGTTYYFQTEITNTDQEYPTIVSLFFSSFPTSWKDNTEFSGLGFGVQEPSNSYHTYNATQSPDFYLIRNAFIDKNDGHNKEASLSVKWFVVVPAGNEVTLNLGTMFLTYN